MKPKALSIKLSLWVGLTLLAVLAPAVPLHA